MGNRTSTSNTKLPKNTKTKSGRSKNDNHDVSTTAHVTPDDSAFVMEARQGSSGIVQGDGGGGGSSTLDDVMAWSNNRRQQRLSHSSDQQDDGAGSGGGAAAHSDKGAAGGGGGAGNVTDEDKVDNDEMTSPKVEDCVAEETMMRMTPMDEAIAAKSTSSSRNNPNTNVVVKEKKKRMKKKQPKGTKEADDQDEVVIVFEKEEGGDERRTGNSNEDPRISQKQARLQVLDMMIDEDDDEEDDDDDAEEVQEMTGTIVFKGPYPKENKRNQNDTSKGQRQPQQQQQQQQREGKDDMKLTDQQAKSTTPPSTATANKATTATSRTDNDNGDVVLEADTNDDDDDDDDTYHTEMTPNPPQQGLVAARDIPGLGNRAGGGILSVPGAYAVFPTTTATTSRRRHVSQQQHDEEEPSSYLWDNPPPATATSTTATTTRRNDTDSSVTATTTTPLDAHIVLDKEEETELRIQELIRERTVTATSVVNVSNRHVKSVQQDVPKHHKDKNTVQCTNSNRMMVVLLLGIVCIIVGFTVGISKSSSSSKDDGDSINDTSMAPTPAVAQTTIMSRRRQRFELLLQDLLVPIYQELEDDPVSLLLDPPSSPFAPQHMAYTWLVENLHYHDDTILNGLEEQDIQLQYQILESYVIVLLYYVTNGAKWLSQMGFLSSPISVGGGSEASNITTICDWNSKDQHNRLTAGIGCNDEQSVTGILLVNNNLNGTLPIELALLTSLEELNLARNKLIGTLPQLFMQKFNRLEVFNVERNSLSGSLPEEKFIELYQIEYFHLSANQFTGTIPTNLLQFTSLKEIFLDRNYFTGSIPHFTRDTSTTGSSSSSSPFSNDKLTYINVRRNYLTGTIPESLYTSQMKRIYVHENFLTGTLSTSGFLQLDRIQRILMMDNIITGTIPSEIGTLAELRRIHFGANRLTGTIPSEIGLPNRMERIILWQNQLSGTLPTEIVQLTSLDWLLLGQNNFTANLTGICNEIYGVQMEADCGGTTPQVHCPCCVACCDAQNHTKDCIFDQYALCQVHVQQYTHPTGEYYADGAGTECGCDRIVTTPTPSNPSDSGTDTVPAAGTIPFMASNNTEDNSQVPTEDEEEIEFWCHDTQCQSCNRDNTICSVNYDYRYTYLDSNPRLWDWHVATIQYVLGINDTVVVNTTSKAREGLCFVTINGQPCNSCHEIICPSGFEAWNVNCENVVGAGSVNVCDDSPDDDGPLTVFALQDPALRTGCAPRLAHP